MYDGNESVNTKLEIGHFELNEASDCDWMEDPQIGDLMQQLADESLNSLDFKSTSETVLGFFNGGIDLENDTETATLKDVY